MKYFLNLSFTRPALLLSLTLLAACSVQPERPLDGALDPAEGARYAYSLSVDISASSRPQEVAAHYGGEVVVWRPEAGFAILGLDDSLSTQNLEGADAELNQGQVAAPEVVASSVWGEGDNAWSGGDNAWSGGMGIASNSTLFQKNWEAWLLVDLSGGLESAPRQGAGVKVAVIDSGLDLEHPAFYNRLAPAHEWKDFVDGDAYPQEERSESSNDNYGHGTGVAGIVSQVAPNATILPLRVLDAEGVGDVTDVAAAIDHAIASGADVINLSLGTDEDSEVLNQMIAYAAERKVFVIASSGNTGDDKITYPARNAKQAGKAGDYLLSVGSAKTYGGVVSILSEFSTYGADLELTAPGERIYTAFPNNQMGYWSGTSFSAPMVTGTLALMLGEDEEEHRIAGKLDDLVSAADLSYLPLHVEGFVDWVLD